MRIAQRRNLSLTTTNRRSATARKAKISVSRRGRALSAAVVAVRHPRRRCRRCAAFHHFPVWWTPLTATANPREYRLPYIIHSCSPFHFSAVILISPQNRISAATATGGCEDFTPACHDSVLKTYNIFDKQQIFSAQPNQLVLLFGS